MCYSFFSSPIGELLLTSDGEALTGLDMCQHRGKPASEPAAEMAPGRFGVSSRPRTVEQLTSRASCASSRLPLRMAGTPFQRLVWEGLQGIPYGATVSYAELARRIGRPGHRELSGRRMDEIRSPSLFRATA